jgi:hypothetical protein
LAHGSAHTRDAREVRVVGLDLKQLGGRLYVAARAAWLATPSWFRCRAAACACIIAIAITTRHSLELEPDALAVHSLRGVVGEQRLGRG